MAVTVKILGPFDSYASTAFIGSAIVVQSPTATAIIKPYSQGGMTFIITVT